MALKPNRKQIVIDASVARSAGGEKAIDPTSKNCRDVLLAILKICHHVVESEATAAEWKKHRSNFATTWRVQMVARKKIVRLEIAENVDLRGKVTSKVIDSHRDAMLKDFHLLEAAIATDEIVISLDNKVRNLFAIACTHSGEIGNIIWVHPDEESILSWLEDGAKSQPEKQLRNYQQE